MVATLNEPDSFMNTRASKGIVRNYASATPSSGGNTKDFFPIVNPVSDYNLLDRMVRNDDVISAAFDIIVDMTTMNGWDFIPKVGKEDNDSAKKEADKARTKFFQLDFGVAIDNVLYSMLYYGDSWLELRKKRGKGINELHTLESTEMRISHNEHGEVHAYVQRPFNLVNLRPEEIRTKENELGIWFKPEEVIHFAIKKVGSTVYSQTPLEPLARIWSTRLMAIDYLFKSYRDLPPEILIHLSGASDKQAEDLMGQFIRKQQFPGRPIISHGKEDSKIDLKKIEFNPGEALNATMEFLRNSIVNYFRIPRSWLPGATAGSNRGDAESQGFNLVSKLRKIQIKLQNQINKDLMPKLGFNLIEFNFNPVSARDEKNVIANASVLQSMNLKPEAVIRYLHRNGITDVRKEDFKTPEEMNMFSQKNQTASNQLSPSRQPMDKNTQDMAKGVDSAGVSDSGGKKLEDRSINQK